MTKTIELLVVLALLVFSFLAGVKYSDSVRERASWLFDSKEEEVELPDLSGEAPADAAPVDQNGVALENPAAAPAAAAPTPAAAPVAPAAAPTPAAQ